MTNPSAPAASAVRFDDTRLIALGTGGYHPNGVRETSCFFVPRWNLLLDAGSGIYRLPRYFTGGRLDILLSHAHLDHVHGLTVLPEILHVCQHTHDAPVESVHLWSAPEYLRTVRECLLDRRLFPAEVDLVEHEVAPEQPLDLPDVTAIAREQTHPGGSLAYRVTDAADVTLVYATDTTGDASPSFGDFAADADLLIHECNFREGEEALAERTGHTAASGLPAIIAACRPRHTMVTHINSLETGPDPIGVGDEDPDLTVARDGYQHVLQDARRGR